jgi:hypothetical protein
MLIGETPDVLGSQSFWSQAGSLTAARQFPAAFIQSIRRFKDFGRSDMAQ